MEAHELATKGSIWESQQRLMGRLDHIEALLNMLLDQKANDGSANKLQSTYNAKALKDMFGVTYGTIRNWRQSGLLKGLQPAGPEGHWIYTYEDNKDFIKQRVKKKQDEA